MRTLKKLSMRAFLGLKTSVEFSAKVFKSWFTKKGKRRYDGQCLLLYFLLYGLGRAWIEGLRTDSLYITGTGIRVSQLLAGVSAAAAAVVLALLYTGKLRHPPRYVDRGTGGQPNA